MKLETPRLIIRQPKPDDANDYLSFCNSEFVLRYNAMTPRTKEQIDEQFSRENNGFLLLELKETGKVIGAVFIDDDSLRWDVNSKELSYFISKAFSRQGYMKEALKAVIRYLFETEELACIAARSFTPNEASRALLASLGFHQDGLIPHCVKGYKGIIFDDTLWSLLREEYTN
ncbi:MAG: GNAT family N-acetyltransferase [Oscillospiraceae bacterium]|nr:GNAT family N-acetyltransferase [Oscillospiraceae bacterium]